MIIFDPDFNPHQVRRVLFNPLLLLTRRLFHRIYKCDNLAIEMASTNIVQAIARAYRYGQQKTCLVFKLMVKDSAEGMYRLYNHFRTCNKFWF